MINLNEYNDGYFDEQGRLKKEIYEYLWRKWRLREPLHGIEAALWLSYEYAARTHDNYKEEYFFKRVDIHTVNDLRIKYKGKKYDVD